MDLRPTSEDEAFRRDVREFVARELPDDIRRKVLGFLRVERDDYVRWQRILHALALRRVRPSLLLRILRTRLR